MPSWSTRSSPRGAPEAIPDSPSSARRSTTSPTALLQQPGPKKSGPVETTLGGYPATRIDLVVPKGFDLGPCNAADIGLQIWYSPPADKNFVLLDHGIASVYIVDVDGERQVFLTQRGTTTSDDDLCGAAGGPRLDHHRVMNRAMRPLSLRCGG